MIETVPATHIRVDAAGVAWIDETNVKAIEVAVDHLAYGLSAAEIHLQHPHLSLAQVHAALAYYYDHQSDLDRQIEERHRAAETLREQGDYKPSRAELSARLKGK